MSSLSRLVEYSDSESESDENDKSVPINELKRKLSEIDGDSKDSTLPVVKKQKLSKNENEDDGSDEDDDDIADHKQKKKIKLKRLSKPSSLLSSKNESKSIEFLQSMPNKDKLSKMQNEMYNKHNSKQLEKEKRQKEEAASIKESIAMRMEHQKQIRNKLSKLPAVSDCMRSAKSVKDKERAKRTKGQSSHHSWKSETFMLLRQQFD